MAFACKNHLASPGIFTSTHKKVGLYFFVFNFGGLAQLGEHLLCKQGVVGSIPSSSTKKPKCKSKDLGLVF